MIISTLLIQFYGWTGFDPIASLFIAVLIVASVVPLVIDSGKVLCLDVSEREGGIKEALAEVNTINNIFYIVICSILLIIPAPDDRGTSFLLCTTFLAKRLIEPHWVNTHPSRALKRFIGSHRSTFFG